MLHLNYLRHQIFTLHGTVWVALIIAALFLLRRLRHSTLAFALAAFPGTLCHELCHWLVGYMTAGRPTELVLLPIRSGKGYVLGAVRFANVRWFNGALIGLAPLLLLPAAVALLTWRMSVSYHPLTLANLFWAYLVACLLEGCWPSMQDLRIASRSWLLVICLIVIFSGCLVQI